MADNQKIIEARREIGRAFDELPIFKRSRQAALYNFCAVLELESFLAGADPDAVFQVGREAVEATILAIPAIFDKCPPGTESDLAIHRSTYEEAFALFYYARDLEPINVCFELADREQYDVRFDNSSGAIVFEYASKQEAMADTHLRSSELSSRIIRATPEQQREILEIALAARDELRPTILFTGVESINYEMTHSLKSIAALWADALAQITECHLPDSFVIGAYTIADIRAFWGAVQAIVNLHDGAHRLSAGPDQRGWPVGSAVHIRRTAEWASLIADISPLSVDMAADLLSWYTFTCGHLSSQP